MDTTNTSGFLSLLRRLRQVRQFRPDPVDPAILTALLEVARWTGSANNRQPWEFVVVRANETLRAIAQEEGNNSYLADAPCAILILMAGQNPELETYDEGRLTERLMLAAAAHGLGAGIYWFKDGGAAAKHLLGIPAERRVRTAVALGYPPESTRPPRPDARKPLSALVHEERY